MRALVEDKALQFWSKSSFILLATAYGLCKEVPVDPALQFRADYYERNLKTQTVLLKGNAWVKKGNQEIWADEIETDLEGERTVANGGVHLKDELSEVFCRHGTSLRGGQETLIEDGTIISGKMVITGSQIRKVGQNRYEIDQGTYTNCNLDLLSDTSVNSCEFDWKISGSYLEITREEYAYIHDAIFYVKLLPVFYTPYLVVPVKAERQSGLLFPSFTNVAHMGSGMTLPFFWAMSPWQDMTIYPTLYSGEDPVLKESTLDLHSRFDYQYIYSPDKQGSARLGFTTRKFSPDRSRLDSTDPERNRLGAFIGEWALDVNNTYYLSERLRTRQILRRVSDPKYAKVLPADLPAEHSLGYLRSQFSAASPWDSWLFAGQVQHQQNLIISKDTPSGGGAVDQGAPVRLPELFVSRTNRPFFGKYLSTEIDLRFANYARPGKEGFDQVPDTVITNGVEVPGPTDSNLGYDSNDYIRTGKRLQVEPRLVASVPMPPGFQFQPVLKGGSLLYQFDIPETTLINRNYLDLELPLSMYLAKKFETSISGYEKISHVFQPRLIYAKNLYHYDEGEVGAKANPFFYRNSVYSNPRFDINDVLTRFEYMRVEMINRFRRKDSATGKVERFLLLSLATQYNMRTDDRDPRYARRLGPVELLGDLAIWRFRAQVQAEYQLELNEGVREGNLSATVGYVDPVGDSASVNGVYSTRKDETLSNAVIAAAVTKSLPTFFDVSAKAKYSARRGEFQGYEVGFRFAAKPRSCWELHLLYGRDDVGAGYGRVLFLLDFGSSSQMEGFNPTLFQKAMQ